eukprot:TRINITY_DN1558_c0_g1_i4.p1 TRINITY_DN1558_c0_g1~~TRINITY_DN1558_c0_g1_i4.p1  ORF type:complete len:225 (+),score=63.21 TRINITY_DN1558_c0_g1_i4:129-803(+)
MEVIDDLDEEMQGICEEIEKGLAQIKNKRTKPEVKQSTIAFLESRIERIKTVYKSYKIELRDLSKAQQDPYKKKGQEYETRINTMIQDLNFVQDGGEVKGAERENLDNMTSDQVLQKGSKVQDESIAAAKRMQEQIERTKEVGVATAAELQIQTDKLKEVGANVEQVQFNLKQANKQLRAFARRVATDKILVGFMCLLVIGIIVLIIVKIVKKRQADNGGKIIT